MNILLSISTIFYYCIKGVFDRVLTMGKIEVKKRNLSSSIWAILHWKLTWYQKLIFTISLLL